MSGNAGPRTFCSLAQNLLVAGILIGRLPGEVFRDADKGMKDDEDGFVTATVGVREGRIIGRIGIARVLHTDRITKAE